MKLQTDNKNRPVLSLKVAKRRAIMAVVPAGEISLTPLLPLALPSSSRLAILLPVNAPMDLVANELGIGQFKPRLLP
jgi:hypothetical protein